MELKHSYSQAPMAIKNKIKSLLFCVKGSPICSHQEKCKRYLNLYTVYNIEQFGMPVGGGWFNKQA